MASYGSKSGGGGGGITASGNAQREAQKPTNSRIIDNMNEAQIDREIEAARRQIQNADAIMSRNNITNTAEANAMREAFPLGAGYQTAQQRRRMGVQNERDARKAAEYTRAYENKQAAQNRLEKLEQAKKEVAGTGKTVRQARKEKVKAAENAPKSLQWKSSKSGAQKVYESGNMRITHQPGGFFVLNVKGREYLFDKLKTAQAAADRLK